MFISPYDTTACKNHRMKDVYQKVMAAAIEGDLLHVNDSVFFVPTDATDIPLFTHPIVITGDDLRRTSKDAIVVCDSRQIARVDKATGELKGGPDFTFATVRSMLMATTWVQNEPRDLLNCGDLSIKLFARLLSENMGRRLNLTVDVQLKVEVIAAYYYLGLFEGVVVNDETGRLKSAKRLSRVVHLPMDEILSLLDSVEPMHSLGDFTRQIVEQDLSVRLHKLAPGVLYAMLGGIWFGNNAVETVAVALEHPPTWCAMVHMVSRDRSYRKTILGQLLQRIDRRGELSDAFSTNVSRLIKVDD